jgi:anti-repressor protein
MLERNAQGKKARKYFIESEKKLRSLSIPSYQIQDGVERAKRWIEEQEQFKLLEQKTLENQPKVEFYDKVAEAKNVMEMSVVAKTLGTGRTTLFRQLREKGILRYNNEPYQEYIDRGWFAIKVQVYQDGLGNSRINNKTMVTAKGVQKIDELTK